MENIEEQKLEDELLDIIINECKMRKSTLNLFKRKDKNGIVKMNYTKLYNYVYNRLQDKIERLYECNEHEIFEEGYSEVVNAQNDKLRNKYEDMVDKIEKIAKSLHLELQNI